MKPDDYQKQAARTLIDGPDFAISPRDLMIVWNAIGLAGEAGEIADLVKKGIFHQHGLDPAKVHEELGDLMWYVAALCTKLGISLESVMAANIAKLERRYPSGYSSEASKARVDISPATHQNASIGPMPFMRSHLNIGAVERASVRSPMPGDMAVCLHCQEQIKFSQMGFWIHRDPTDPKVPEHNPEPHPF